MPRAGKNPSCWGQRELCKGPRGICPRQKSQLLSLGCPLPSPPPPAAVWDVEGGRWLWAAVPDGSGPPAPVKVPRGDKGSLWIWGGKSKALVAGPGTPPSPLPAALLPSQLSHCCLQPASHLCPPSWKTPPASLGTCTLRQNEESNLKITPRSQQSSPVGLPPPPAAVTAHWALCKSLSLLSWNRNREPFIQHCWECCRKANQACPRRGGQTPARPRGTLGSTDARSHSSRPFPAEGCLPGRDRSRHCSHQTRCKRLATFTETPPQLEGPWEGSEHLCCLPLPAIPPPPPLPLTPCVPIALPGAASGSAHPQTPCHTRGQQPSTHGNKSQGKTLPNRSQLSLEPAPRPPCSPPSRYLAPAPPALLSLQVGNRSLMLYQLLLPHPSPPAPSQGGGNLPQLCFHPFPGGSTQPLALPAGWDTQHAALAPSCSVLGWPRSGSFPRAATTARGMPSTT